jgi:hypothetical protein
MAIKPESASDDFVTVQEAARMRGVSRSRIHQWIQEARLRKEERYGRTVVSLSEVMNLEKLKVGRPPQTKSEETESTVNKNTPSAKNSSKK